MGNHCQTGSLPSLPSVALINLIIKNQLSGNSEHTNLIPVMPMETWGNSNGVALDSREQNLALEI